MVILGENGLSAWVKRLLDLVFIGGVFILISLPLSLRWGFNYRWSAGQRYDFLLIFLLVTGIFALLILHELRKMFVTLNKQNPFQRENVACLKKISFYAFVIAAAYLIKIIFYPSFLTIILPMVFIIIGLFTTILAEVFHQAAEVKEENDLTI